MTLAYDVVITGIRLGGIDFGRPASIGRGSYLPPRRGGGWYLPLNREP